MIEAIVEIIVLIIFSVPGAFIIWALKGFKGSFKQQLAVGDGYLHGVVGLCFIAIAAYLICKLR